MKESVRQIVNVRKIYKYAEYANKQNIQKLRNKLCHLAVQFLMNCYKN